MKPSTKNCVCFLCLLLFITSAGILSAAGVSVQVRGLRIVGPGMGKDNQELRPFNWTEGTDLAVLVVKPGGGLISFDDDKSTLKAFIDNKGTNLLEKKKSGSGSSFSFGRAGFEHSPSFSKDRTACLIEIQGKRVPAKGATAIMATGTLVFNCGSKTKTFTQKDLSFKKGTKVKAGPVQFTIKEVGKPQWGDAAMAVTFEAKQDISAIKEISFLDAQGKKIPAERGGSSTTRFGGSVTIEKAYNFKTKREGATVVITCWTDMKAVSVPFKIQTSVGL